MGNNTPRRLNLGLTAGTLLTLAVSMLLLSSCRGLRVARLGARAVTISQQQATAAARPIKTVVPTPHPTAGPFTDEDSLREYLVWVEARYDPFVDATNENIAALEEQNIRSGRCSVAFFDASNLLQEVSNRRPPNGLQQTHLDFTHMIQQWELARTEMTQYCSGLEDAYDTVEARIQSSVHLSVGVVEDFDAAIAWLNAAPNVPPTAVPLVAPGFLWSPSSAGGQALPSPTPKPGVVRIPSGAMRGGLRVGNLEWRVEGYTLVDYGRQLEVRMTFHALGDGVSVSPNVRLVVDGHEFSPNAVRIVYEYPTEPTGVSEREANQVEPLERGSYLPVRILFSTPPSCMSTETERDACMRAKVMSVRWLQHNVKHELRFRANWD